MATVFPTHVGVFPSRKSKVARVNRLPHARGGVSAQSGMLRWMTPSSPRTWGCFWLDEHYPNWASVFPTHVGVFLSTVTR